MADKWRVRGLTQLLRKAHLESDTEFHKRGVRALPQAPMKMEIEEHSGVQVTSIVSGVKGPCELFPAGGAGVCSAISIADETHATRINLTSRFQARTSLCQRRLNKPAPVPSACESMPRVGIRSGRSAPTGKSTNFRVMSA